MSILYTVSNSSRKKIHIFADDELSAAKFAVDAGFGKKVESMKVKEYDYTKHSLMEQNYLMLLGCRNAIGEMKKNPSLKHNDVSKNEGVVDYDGCFVVFN